MATVLQYRFAMRRRTASGWATLNEVLLLAEWGLETDTDQLKIGDGLTPWNDLPYFNELVAGTGIEIEIDSSGRTVISASGGGASLSRGTATINSPTGSQVKSTVAIAKTLQLLRIATDHPARLRLYATVAERDADAARAAGTAPAAGSGLLFEGITTVGLPLFDVQAATIFNNESTVTNAIPCTLDPTTAVNTTATLTYLVQQP